MPGKRTSRGRSRGPSLSKEKVVATALQIADEQGLSSVTMRKIAEQLGVEAMSLYYHVKNKEAILDELIDYLFGEIELPPSDLPWKEALRVRSISAREVLVKHRWAISVMDSTRNPGPNTLKHHNAVLGVMRNNSVSLGMTAHAYSVIDGYIYGFVMQEQAIPFETQEELAAVAAGMLEAIPREQFPHFVEMVVDHALQPGYSYQEEFEFGLDLILDGIERKVESTDSETPLTRMP